MHGEINFKALGLPGQGAGRARAGFLPSLGRRAVRAGGRGPQPLSRELAGGGLHRVGERGKEFPQEPQLPCCTTGRVEPPRRPAPKGQGLSKGGAPPGGGAPQEGGGGPQEGVSRGKAP
jgi:hypothetical protein